MFELSKISYLLRDGIYAEEISNRDLHFLHGYRWNTLLGYNSGVKKYVKFAMAIKRFPFRLPLSAEDLYDFVYWAGRVAGAPTDHDVAANTLVKYLAGIAMWHLLHGAKYPDDSRLTVTVFLRSSGHVDAETQAKPKKEAVKIKHLVILAGILVNGDRYQKALLDLAIVAFWGMARLTKLTYNSNSGPLRASASLLTTDVSFNDTRGTETISLALRGAKTAAPGESQVIFLRSLPHMLCPVAAVKRRLKEAGSEETSLFGYTDSQGNRSHLVRETVCRTLDQIWKSNGFEGLSGHSFRVGGASLRNALGISKEDICLLGRWTSDCYRLYLQTYSINEIADTKATIAELEKCWAN
ncbi:hypothetical protein MJO29_008355 [Puccinia striiformis f. sp. tritici]|nr:hypothetical protein MJO29_008355 [Puccinia striiformis f. sp. tritici]